MQFFRLQKYNILRKENPKLEIFFPPLFGEEFSHGVNPFLFGYGMVVVGDCECEFYIKWMTVARFGLFFKTVVDGVEVVGTGGSGVIGMESGLQAVFKTENHPKIHASQPMNGFREKLLRQTIIF